MCVFVCLLQCAVCATRGRKGTRFRKGGRSDPGGVSVGGAHHPARDPTPRGQELWLNSPLWRGRLYYGSIYFTVQYFTNHIQMLNRHMNWTGQERQTMYGTKHLQQRAVLKKKKHAIFSSLAVRTYFKLSFLHSNYRDPKSQSPRDSKTDH